MRKIEMTQLVLYCICDDLYDAPTRDCIENRVCDVVDMSDSSIYG